MRILAFLKVPPKAGGLSTPALFWASHSEEEAAAAAATAAAAGREWKSVSPPSSPVGLACILYSVQHVAS